ncbi:MAG: hypothetical protein JWQ87_3898 [Candidatus Sulfotelmatobacter sp.]|nr:hypothetical protein [Candidatus Sulfotelmatobacter sp.]
MIFELILQLFRTLFLFLRQRELIYLHRVTPVTEEGSTSPLASQWQSDCRKTKDEVATMHA